jgi:D-glycero-D-manno-heptose 1,7-bisphosphate phosphatase
MLQRAAQEHDLDLTRSWMIGDKAIDLEAGRRVGCRVALVLTGYGKDVDPSMADLVAEDLPRAIDLILNQMI